MSKTTTVTINGKHYDTHSGLPVEQPIRATSPKAVTHSSGMHASTQRSTTLNRRSVKKHQPKKTEAVVQQPAHKAIATHPQVTHFAPKPIHKPAAHSKALMSDIAPVRHPMAAKVHAKQTAQKQPTKPAHKPAAQIKHEAVTKALHDAKRPVAKKQSLKRRFPKAMSIASASLAVLLLGGYLTYINLPTLSIRVAAVQAGIDASYPDYRPSGYSLSGPIAYSSGNVSMKFAANAGPQNFTINEKKSSWDSSAVLENYVLPAAGEEYLTYTEGGLTIYTYDGDAAWVNDGILYTISGDAPLTGDQVRKIATSL